MLVYGIEFGVVYCKAVVAGLRRTQRSGGKGSCNGHMWTMGRELDVAPVGETGEGTSGGTGLRGLCVPPVPFELYDGED